MKTFEIIILTGIASGVLTVAYMLLERRYYYLKYRLPNETKDMFNERYYKGVD